MRKGFVPSVSGSRLGERLPMNQGSACETCNPAKARRRKGFRGQHRSRKGSRTLQKEPPRPPREAVLPFPPKNARARYVGPVAGETTAHKPNPGECAMSVLLVSPPQWTVQMPHLGGVQLKGEPDHEHCRTQTVSMHADAISKQETMGKTAFPHMAARPVAPAIVHVAIIASDRRDGATHRTVHSLGRLAGLGR